MRLLTLFLAALILAGCQSTSPRPYAGIKHFMLEKPVAIAAGTTRTFFQQGVAKPYMAVDWYAPWCALEVRTLKETATTVQPDTFAITRVQLDEMEVAVRPGVQLAALWKGGVALALGGQERPQTMDAVHLYLHSPRQPNVLRLTCAGRLSDGDPQDAPDSWRPDPARINTILGPYGRLE
ncbi:hypothetical protein SAMN05443662_1491 [Sulfurivirga caldicuralii]|uniref:Lipoprotein n=1 Tax=Sulfurivirga caldicuralii TaxID=364032 RepID=A0A1N6GTQ3_9GAMM|nr:hypothetical protein [Sulfurivirga caldicuralii]SIO10893.1 hypothetical protein SAMN05443662_1491 [Sulfurivirga caldicuralii]